MVLKNFLVSVNQQELKNPKDPKNKVLKIF